MLANNRNRRKVATSISRKGARILTFPTGEDRFMCNLSLNNLPFSFGRDCFEIGKILS